MGEVREASTVSEAVATGSEMLFILLFSNTCNRSLPVRRATSGRSPQHFSIGGCEWLPDICILTLGF